MLSKLCIGLFTVFSVIIVGLIIAVILLAIKEPETEKIEIFISDPPIEPPKLLLPTEEELELQRQKEEEFKQQLQKERYEIMRRDFKTLMVELQTQTNIEVCLMYGTMLGWFRNGDIIQHDNDVDLVLFTEDVPAFRDFIQTSKFKILEDTKHKIFQVVFDSDASDVIEKHAKGMCDLLVFEEVNGLVYDRWNHWVFRKTDFLPLVPTTFLGCEVLVPQKFIYLLENLYSLDFMMPKEDFTNDDRFSNTRILTQMYKGEEYTQVWNPEDVEEFYDQIILYLECLNIEHVLVLNTLEHFQNMGELNPVGTVWLLISSSVQQKDNLVEKFRTSRLEIDAQCDDYFLVRSSNHEAQLFYTTTSSVLEIPHFDLLPGRKITHNINVPRKLNAFDSVSFSSEITSFLKEFPPETYAFNNVSTPETIPIFIITFQRFTVLLESLKSFFKNQGANNLRIVICDNLSSHKKLIEFFKVLRVYYKAQIYINTTNDPFKNTYFNIQTYLHNLPVSARPDYYVITDPDIVLRGENTGAFDFYKSFLDDYPSIRTVGPMLDIHDIPDHYPHKAKVHELHDPIWDRPQYDYKWKDVSYKFVEYAIDTTFGMYRLEKGYRFRSESPEPSACRCLSPFNAQHIDWYLNKEELESDQLLYSQTATKISHWSLTKNGF